MLRDEMAEKVAVKVVAKAVERVAEKVAVKVVAKAVERVSVMEVGMGEEREAVKVEVMEAATAAATAAETAAEMVEATVVVRAVERVAVREEATVVANVDCRASSGAPLVAPRDTRLVHMSAEAKDLRLRLGDSKSLPIWRLASAASTTRQTLRPNSMGDLISEVKRADADKRARRLLEEREMIAARQALNRKLRAISTLQTAMRKRRWRKMISSNSTHGPTCAPAARMTPPAQPRPT